jgi:Concanavalin A-like lectin/glucanases superfamily
MAFNFSPKIVTDGLVQYLDASNPSSYPGSGTTWYDMSRGGNNITLTNSPTYTIGTQNSFFFNGSNNYGTFVNNPIYTAYGADPTNQKWTIDCWYSVPNILARQPLIGPYGGGIGFGFYFDFSPTNFQPLMYTDGDKYLYGSVAATGTTNSHITFVFDGSSGQRNQYMYLNGVLIGSRQDSTSETYPTLTNTMYLGYDGSQYLYGNLYALKMYTKALSATEVLQNYNATKTRYGL